MNENIRKLAEQFRMNFSINGYPHDGIHWDNVEEFAELIVAECAGLVDHVIMEDGNSRGDFIRKHFGVE
jgi:hypothetical protein